VETKKAATFCVKSSVWDFALNHKARLAPGFGKCVRL